MANALGWVSVPVVPTFSGITKKLASGLVEPTEKAGRSAAKSMDKSAQDMVSSLERQVKASTGKLKQLEQDYSNQVSKREEQQHRLNAALAKQQDAQRKLNDVRGTNKEAAAVAALETARARVVSETVKLKKAEQDVTKVEKDHKRQLDDLNETTKRYHQSQEELTRQSGRMGKAMEKTKGFMKDTANSVTEMGGPLGGVAETLTSFKFGPAAGVAAVASGLGASAGAALAFSENMEKATTNIQNRLGVTKKVAQDMQLDVAEALKSGLGDYEQATESVIAIQQTLADESAHMAGQTAGQLADNFLSFTDTFSVGMAEAVSTVDVMLNTGMAKSVEQGVDLLTAGLQKVPEAMQGEVLDAVNEYSKFFANMGIDGSEAMAMLVEASKQGQYAIDKTGDAVKEFSLRAVDSAVLKTLSEAGVSVENLADRVAKGGPEAADALSETVDQLMNISSEGERAEAAIAIFGAPLEDLSVSQIPAFLEGLKTSEQGMKDFAGASQKMADNTSSTLSGMVSAWKGQVHSWAIETTLSVNQWAGEMIQSFQSSGFVEKLSDLWARVVDSFNEAIDLVVAGWGRLTEYFSQAYQLIAEPVKRVFDGVVDWTRDFRDKLLQAFDGDRGLIELVVGPGDFKPLEWLKEQTSGVQDTLGALWDWIQNKAETIVDFFKPLATALFDLAKSVIPPLVDTVKSLWDVVLNLVTAFGSVQASVLGSVFSSLVQVGKSLWEVLKSLWEALKPVLELLGRILLPILKVVGAVLGGVLVVAVFAFIGALKVVAEVLAWVADKVAWLVENLVGPLIEGLAKVAGFILEKLVGALSWLVEHAVAVLATIVEHVAKFANYLIKNFWPATKAVFEWLAGAWDVVIEAFGVAWTWVKDNILSPAVQQFHELGENVTSAVEWIAQAWRDLGQWLTEAWNVILDYVIGPMIQGYKNLWKAVLEAVDWIAQKWDWLAEQLAAGWGWVKSSVFDPLGQGLQTLKGWFQDAVNGIADIWDTLKKKLAKPINWVITSVYNDGIRKVWDEVSSLIGMSNRKLAPVPSLAFARGGITPGPATPGRDIHRYVSPTGGIIELSGREAIMRPEWTEAVGEQYIHEMNAVAARSGVSGIRQRMARAAKHYAGGGVLPVQRFASGGVVDSIVGLVNRFFPSMSITSTYRNTPDLHGQGKAVDASNGFDTTPEMQEMARFFYQNYGSGLAELIHWPLNGWKNVDEGRPFDFGEPTNSQHRNHVHIASHAALPAPDNAGQWLAKIGEHIKGGLSGALNWVKDKVRSVAETVFGSIRDSIPNLGEGWAGQVPRLAFEEVTGRFLDFVLKTSDSYKDSAGEYEGTTGSAGSVESWRSMAVEAMRRQGFNADDPAQVNAMLAQIGSESGGDPNIAQQIVDVNGTGESAGVGLLQIIPGTFAANRDPALANDRRDPWANMNAALRYYKGRYGSDLTTMWGHGHGYKSGGVVDIAKLLGAKLYDVGGVMPHGTLAFNDSGEDEFVLKNSGMRSLGEIAKNLGVLIPVLRGQSDAVTQLAESTNRYVANLGSAKSEEGLAARSFVRQFLELGSQLPGAEVIGAVLDGEQTLWDARDRHVGHLNNLAEKEDALANARKRLQELKDSEVELSGNDARKLEDAQAALDKAKANLEVAETEEQRASAAEKVAEAEKKLNRVREDSMANADEVTKKRAEDIKKATQEVDKAEREHAQARKQQVKDLDHITLISQESIQGLVPVAEGLASQLISMGASVPAVEAGLSSVVSGIAGLAGAAGPAGISLGMAIEALKVGVTLIRQVVETITELVDRWYDSQIQAYQIIADGFSVVAQYADLNEQIHAQVAELQQSLVRGMLQQEEAAYNLKIAINDRLIAEAEGVVAVAEARSKLDQELERGARIAQLKMMGLYEDWDSYLSFQADVSAGVLDQWSDSAVSALLEYEAARAKALQGELQAKVDQIKAEAALAEATRQNLRNQQDLISAQERLIKMSAKVAGVDLVEATALSEVTKLMTELQEVQKNLDKNLLGKAGYKLGTHGQYSTAYRGDLAKKESLQRTIKAVLKESDLGISESRIQQAVDEMASAALGGINDPKAIMRNILPEVVAAEEALRTDKALEAINDARKRKTDAERGVEDLAADVALANKLGPLEKQIKGLDYTTKSLEDAAKAFKEGDDAVRGKYFDLSRAREEAARRLGVEWEFDPKYSTPQLRERITKEVTIHMDGDRVYTADEVDQLINHVVEGSSVRVNSIKSASTVANARRKETV